MPAKPKNRPFNIRPVGTGSDGKEYAVVNLKGEGSFCRTPCESCPWKQSSKIGAFPAEAFRESAKTAYDMAETIFGCHSSPNKGMTCAGFILRGSDHNMTMRMKTMCGEIDPELVTDGGHELYDSYRDMAEANGVPRRDPTLRLCRSAED